MMAKSAQCATTTESTAAISIIQGMALCHKYYYIRHACPKYLSTPHVVNYLIECVQRKLETSHLSRSLTETNPFVVTSIAEFEMAGHAISHLGVGRFCTGRAISGPPRRRTE